MSFDLFFWEPALGLDPDAPDFDEQLESLHRDPLPPPSPTLVNFVNALLERYPALSDDNEDAIWSDAPLAGNIAGRFIHLAMGSIADDEALQFILSTAAAHGLNIYDPQGGEFYPVETD